MSPAKPDEPERTSRFGRRKPEQGAAPAPGADGPRVPPPATRPPGVRTAGEIVDASEAKPEAKPEPQPEATSGEKPALPKAAPATTTAGPKPARPVKEKPAKAKPDKEKKPKQSAAIAVRTRIAAIVWAVAVICALVLAVAALLVALQANQDNAAVSAVLDGADVLDLGIFSRDNGVFTFDGAEAETRSALVNWGLGAVAYLVLGKLLDRIIHP